MQIDCPLNSNKQYIIPTTAWLNPIQKLKTNDISSKGLIMLSKYMNNHDVVVKITKNVNNQIIKKINDTVRGLTNFPAVFCVISCLESDINLETEYKNISGYCERSTDTNTEITLEIMKKYKRSLTEYVKKLNLNAIKPLLQQILFAQLNAFEKTGFLHNDVHLGNILFDFKQNEEVELKYSFDKNNYVIKTHWIVILMDFDKSIIMDPLNGIEHDKYDYMTKIDEMKYPPFDLNNRIYVNIIKTLHRFVFLLDPETRIKMDDLINKLETDNIEQYGGTEHSLMNAMYNGTREYPNYVNESIHNVIQMLNRFWHELFGEYLFPKYTFQKS